MPRKPLHGSRYVQAVGQKGLHDLGIEVPANIRKVRRCYRSGEEARGRDGADVARCVADASDGAWNTNAPVRLKRVTAAKNP
jgi:hypothetical protein